MEQILKREKTILTYDWHMVDGHDPVTFPAKIIDLNLLHSSTMW